MKKIFCTLLLLLSSSVFASHVQRAVVITPVADLLGQPYSRSPNKKISFQQYYHQIPFSGSGVSCMRLHQLLFNEIVSIIEERGEEVKVKVSNFYYLKDNDSIPYDVFWTLKKNLVTFETLFSKSVDISKFPRPVSYSDQAHLNEENDKVVTLKKPYHDPVTKKTFSVGTRFVTVGEQDLSGVFDQGSFEVYVLDPTYLIMREIKIPKRYCIRNYFKGQTDQVANFVKLLRSWTYQKNGFIPYVLGGSSWTANCHDHKFQAIEEENSNNYFHRKEWDKTEKIGFDCVGIIGRAAQICNIPFYFKNTTTLLKELETLKEKETISEGDLIWLPGHVMVVSDTKKNLIIESRGYDNGWGKVQELALQQIFEGVLTFADLKKHCLNKDTLQLLNSEGKPFRKCKRVKILKLKSVWNKF